MKETRRVRCEICFQKGKHISTELPLNTKKILNDEISIHLTEEMKDGCQFGKIGIHIRNESCRENTNLSMEKPIKVWLPLECPEKITAMYLFNEWWTRPAFVEKFEDIPNRTQTVFLKYKDRYVCIILAAGKEYKTYMTGGTQEEVCMEMTAGLGGQNSVEETLYLIAEASDFYEAVHKAFKAMASYKGIRIREERRFPEMFRYLGWCSWDAFYRNVNEDGIKQKAREFKEKKIPIRWMLIDDGWLSETDEMLCEFTPDKNKFPNGFKTMTDEIKKETNICWFGVWHTLGGYWGGIAPGSKVAHDENSYLYQTVNGKLLPSPFTGEKFYREWYDVLNREGICFVKVDGQSAVPYYFENSLPLGVAAKGMNESLESGASRMDGAVINCMGMAMENIFSRPVSAISRNSDDFVPDKKEGFSEHLLQNAYNALYHNEIYCCDWDMFWTMHEDAVKHSLLRGISGGPIYISDKPGSTNGELLAPLAYHDGEILMMKRSAKPTEDCIFSDPFQSGVLKLHNIASYGCKKAGGIAVYNVSAQKKDFSFMPADIPDLEMADKYWVYDYFEKRVFSLERKEKYEGNMDASGYKWYVILPRGVRGSCVGLVDKYVGFTAVESILESENMMIAVIHESGNVGWISEKEPCKVLMNGKDFTQNYKKTENLYEIEVEEDSSPMVLSIYWEEDK